MLPIFIASIPDDYEREFVTGLYTRFYSPMLAKALAMVSDRGIAEEIVQETFLRIVKSAPRIMRIVPQKQPYFLMVILRNTAVDFQRELARQGRHFAFSLDDDAVTIDIADSSPQPEEIYLRKELFEEVAEEVQKLSERDRLLLEARYLLDKTDEEIASQFNLTADSARAALSRARRRAYKLLQKEC